jgi:hypothetical protein
MKEVDRSNFLQELDQRHTVVLGELEQLELQVEAVLAAVRPAADSKLRGAALTAAGRAGPTC